jgi:hypothetical protein
LKAVVGRDRIASGSIGPGLRFAPSGLRSLAELQTKAATDVARVLSGEKPVYPVKG